jgi:hypothetical protein
VSFVLLGSSPPSAWRAVCDRDTGAAGTDRYHWTVPVFGATDPVAAGRTRELERHGRGHWGRSSIVRSRMDHQLGTRAVTSLSTASQLPPRPPSDRPAFSRQYRILTIDRGEVYRASSQAGPGNDINAGSTGSQKAPTWSPASLVAFRANAGRAASRRSLSAPLSLTARQSPVFSGAGVSAFRLRTMLRQVVEEVGTATA